jgi:hypothetical protein
MWAKGFEMRMSLSSGLKRSSVDLVLVENHDGNSMTHRLTARLGRAEKREVAREACLINRPSVDDMRNDVMAYAPLSGAQIWKVHSAELRDSADWFALFLTFVSARELDRASALCDAARGLPRDAKGIAIIPESIVAEVDRQFPDVFPQGDDQLNADPPAEHRLCKQNTAASESHNSCELDSAQG